MNYLLNSNELPSRIDIYLTKFRKTLDYSGIGPIASDSVNSAVTDGQNIVILGRGSIKMFGAWIGTFSPFR